MIDTGLRDRVAIVTGANHGIGAATAMALAAQGAAVLVHYLRLPLGPDELAATSGSVPGMSLYRARQAQSGAAVVQAIRERGGRAEAWEGDLARPETVGRLFDVAEATWGPVDVLVNNAAAGAPDSFHPLAPDAQDWAGRSLQTVTAVSHDHHFAVNSRAVALMMAEFARRHVERRADWGRIINVSTDGASGFPGEVSYGASKAALESYSRAAAVELGRYGITVNIASPGPIQTGWIAPADEEAIVGTIPLGRLGTPDDVADVIVFLASEQARWLTGQTLYVGGGHTTKGSSVTGKIGE